MNRKKSITVLAIGFLAIAAFGRDYWTAKPWQQWSAEDCTKMLRNSPWARTWSTSSVEFPVMGQSSNGTAREQDPIVYYFVQVRSALPVRQAVAREAELDSKYDKMTPAQKKAIDASVSSYLARNYDDEIIIHFDYQSNVEIYQRDLMQAWQSLPPGSIPENTFLIGSKGRRVLPTRVQVAPEAQPAVEFIFPRTVNGEPVISPDDKSLAFQFTSPAIGPFARQLAYIEFNPRKMMFNGQLSY